MILRLVDPWFLLRLYEFICWTAAAIVAAGIVAEFARLLLLWIVERPRNGVRP